jgi:hypothetical protein
MTVLLISIKTGPEVRNPGLITIAPRAYWHLVAGLGFCHYYFTLKLRNYITRCLKRSINLCENNNKIIVFYALHNGGQHLVC